MGQDNNIDRPRKDYKDRTRAILDKHYDMAEEMTRRAHEIVMSGEDIRSNKERPGVASLEHSVSRAIDEIVRLTGICGAREDRREGVGKSVGWSYDPEKEKALLEFATKSDA